MNKSLIFLIFATSILVLSAIVICVSPIINNIEVEVSALHTWRPADWRNLNCQFFADKIKDENINLDYLQKYKKFKNLCYRQKAMYGLENSVFIINIILAFICADFTLLHYLNVGKSFEKKTGLIGLISGIIGFILTLAYVCFSGYIFNNDVAYGFLDLSQTEPNYFIHPNFLRLFPNGAIMKIDSSGITYAYQTDEIGEYSQYVLYKDLGKKQYNYNTNYFQTYYKDPPPSKTCRYDDGVDVSCEYIYFTPEEDVINKYVHDRWLTALILAVIIVFCHLGFAIFGFLLFKKSEEMAPSSEQAPIIYKK
jgi:hypothetical protein